MGPKSHNWCPYKKAIRKHRKEDDVKIRRKEGQVMTQEDVEVVQLQGMAKLSDSYQQLRTTKYHTKALKFIGENGVCYSEFSPGPALCRFVFQLRGRAANKHKYNFTTVVIMLLIIMELQDFPSTSAQR